MDLMAMIKAKKQQIQEQSGRREKTVKPQNGKSRWRILPGWRDGDPTFWHDFGQHFIKGVTPNENGSYLRSVYICTAKTFGTPCPICEAVSEGLRIAPNDDAVQALNESKSGSSILVNALHRDGDDPNTPVIMEMRPSIFKQVLEIIETYGDITDPKAGFDVIVNREGRGLNTKYSVMPAPTSEPVPAAALNALHNLDDYVKQEWEEGKQKALASVRESVPMLAAPGATAASSAGNDDEPFAMPQVAQQAAPAVTVTSAQATATQSDPIEGQATVVQPAVTQPAAQAAATVASNAPVMSDEDMDALLADL